MADIDVGYAGTGSGYTSTNTYLDLNNPANDSGIIDTLVLYLERRPKQYVVGMMALRSGTTYYARDFANLGTLGIGKITITGLSVDVVANDNIAMWHSGGAGGGLNFKTYGVTGLRYPTTGGAGLDSISDQGDYDFNNLLSGYAICAYATGETVAAGGGALVGGSSLVGGQILCGNSPLIN